MATADNDLQAALALFNEGLKVQQDAERAQRAIDKAERRKQQAANTLKKVQGTADATGDEKAEAEAAYRTAVDEFTRLRSGEALPPADEDATGDEPGESAAGQAPADEDATGDEPGESAAAQAPADEDPPDPGDPAAEPTPEHESPTDDVAVETSGEEPADEPAHDGQGAPSA